MISAEKSAKFLELFGEFVPDFLSQARGQEHLKHYEEGRAQGRANFEEIREEARHGNVPTEKVLQKLLPHTDTATHRKLGVWVHIAPAIQGDIRNWFEGAGWTQAEDWPRIASAILSFVQKSAENPSALESTCREFVSLPYTTGFQTGMLTPILNALRPDEFMIINNKSRTVTNFFTEKTFKQRLLDYPAANAAARGLIAEMEKSIKELSKTDARSSDLFDMFCHWLVAEKKTLPPYTKGERIHLSGDQVVATVPDDEREEDAAPGEPAVQAPAYKVQAALAEIGAKMGFQIWIPRADRLRVLQYAPNVSSALLDELPLNYVSLTLKTIEQIDVIWIKRHSIARAFEVEQTTAVYSGLLRMADLLALQPDINVRIHIVAPDEKHDKVMKEIKRPIFSSLEKGPLYRRCSYIPYSSVEELQNLKGLEYMTDAILKEYEEFAEED